MDRLRVNLSALERLDVVRLKKKLRSPPQRPLGTIERPVISTAIDVAARLSSTARLLQEVKTIGETARTVAVALAGRSGPMFSMPRSTRFITVGVGAASSIFAGLGITSAAGLYGSNTPEFGLYTSRGAGYWTNIGVSGEVQLAYVFGPPSTFGGVSWGVGVSADIPGVGLGISCQVMFSASGPPFQFLGYAVGVGAGISALPVDISFTVSSTQLIPVR